MATEPEYTEERLRQIFEQRKAYNARVYEGREQPPEETFKVFAETWPKVPDALRKKFEASYALGYDETVRRGAESMEAAYQRRMAESANRAGGIEDR